MIMIAIDSRSKRERLTKGEIRTEGRISGREREIDNREREEQREGFQKEEATKKIKSWISEKKRERERKTTARTMTMSLIIFSWNKIFKKIQLLKLTNLETAVSREREREREEEREKDLSLRFQSFSWNRFSNCSNRMVMLLKLDSIRLNLNSKNCCNPSCCGIIE